MQNTWIWVVVAVVLIGGGYWWYTTQQGPVPAAVDNSSTMSGNANSAPAEMGTSGQVGVDVQVSTPKTVTVNFNGDAFSPKTITINKGDTVRWVSTGGNMWVASAQHPDHTAYSGTTRSQHCPDTSGTAFDECAPGTSYSFTFQKTGTWNYHDHLNAQLFGTVVVQ